MTAGGSFLDKLLLGIKEVEWNGGAVTFRPTINFLGGTVADNAGNDSTDVTLGSGGGGFTPGGDLSGTSTSQSVVGIRGNAIPSLSTGVLQWTGSVWSFATTASIFTAGGDLTGTATSQEVTGLLTHALPSLVSGYLQWTGSAWALSTPGSGFTAGGDLSGTLSSQEVIGVLNHALPGLSTGALNWTGSAWAFTAIPTLPTLTNHDIVLGQGTTTPAFLAPSTAGHVARSNGTDWLSAVLAYTDLSGTPSALPPNGAAGGDLGGTYPNPEVTGLLNHALPSLTNGYLQWNGTSWAFTTPGGGFSAGGDLSGSSSSQEVIGALSQPLPSPLTVGPAALFWTSATGWAFHNAVESISAGTAISVSGGTSTAATITNTGVTSVTAGTGISVSGSTGGVSITNTGVTSITAGTGITLTGTASVPIINVTNPTVTLTNHDLLVGQGTNTPAFIAPSATSGVPLISQGSSANPAFGTAVVAGGGTGLATLTAHAVMLGEGTGNVAFAAPSTAGQALISNGATSDPSFQAVAYTNITGTPSSLPPNGTAGGDLSGTYPNPTVSKIKGGTVSTLAVGAVVFDGANFDFELPLTAAFGGTALSSSGASGNVLTSNGSTWTSASLTAATIAQQVAGQFTGSVTLTGTSIHTIASVTLTTGSSVIIYAFFEFTSNDSINNQAAYGIGVNSSTITTGGSIGNVPNSTVFTSTSYTSYSRIVRVSGLPPGSNTFNFLASLSSTPTTAPGAYVEGVIWS